MTWTPQKEYWHSDKAVLFVHGIGNAKPGDYDGLIEKFKDYVGSDNADKIAIYFLYYDAVNDWFVDKTNLDNILSKIKDHIKTKLTNDLDADLISAISEYAGDVIFPILLEPARVIIKTRYLSQLKQIRIDGKESGVSFHRQKISIICHSLGCFHTYETLHEIAIDRQHSLRPSTDGMQFENIIYMASPVQFIRTIVKFLGRLVPQGNLFTIDGTALRIPSESNSWTGDEVPTTKNWVSISGEFDPVGGYFYKTKADWAFMDMPNQVSILDDQDLLNISNEKELAKILLESLVSDSPPSISINNPHSWDEYIRNHREDLKKWLF